MAGDWIKIRKCLPNDPRIVRMASALKADRFRTLGGTVSAWCLFDEHTDSGRLEGYTPELLDEVVGFPGLAAALVRVGWLEVGDGFLVAPRFEKHNGKTAKRRCQESARKMSARNADKKRTRSGLEKRREEVIDKSITSEVSFALPDVVGLYPKREKVAEAIEALAVHVRKGADLDAVAAGTRAIAAVIARLPGGHLNAYVPSAAAFFRARRWEDDPQTWLRNAGKHTNGSPQQALDLGGRRAASHTLI
jgi:hypothetical protein